MSGKRTPGDDEHLNNANAGAGAVANEHEAMVQARVRQAQEEEQIRQTQASQATSQKGAAKAPKVGDVVISAPRKVQESKYGRELPWPHGTPLVQKQGQNLRPAEGSEEPTHMCGRVLADDGWLVQRAIPIAEAMAGAVSQ